MKKFLFTFILTLATMCVSAQSLGDVPATVSASDVTILKESVVVFAGHDSIAVNPETGKIDTLEVQDGMLFFSPEEYEQLARDPERLRATVAPGESWGPDYGDWAWSWVLPLNAFKKAAMLYTFKYPSVDADGNLIYLSALMGVPFPMFSGSTGSPKNLIIGCHETITSNYECPSEWNSSAGAPVASGNCMMLQYCRNDIVRQPSCLVIIPDYEGYGITKDRAHPYLYQELTARQVVDAVRSGLAFYDHLISIGKAEPMAPGWKSVSIGYSQGGSVSLATHKFIELNGLVDELNYAGSVCGDGPYDPVTHLRYYMKDNGTTYDGTNKTEHREERVSMPIVMPLILKGMCDSNPLMRQHYIDDYLSMKFLYTESIKFIEDKAQPKKKDQYSTDRINEEYVEMLKKGKTGTYTKRFHDGTETKYTRKCSAEYFQDVMELNKDAAFGKLDSIMTPICLDYFRALTENTPVPTEPGLMQDLHRALESNNLTKGWTPQHRIAFFHSTYDTVVPYENLLSFMRNQQSLTYYFFDNDQSRSTNAGVSCTTATEDQAKVYIRDATCKEDHVPAGTNFFMTGATGKVFGLSPDMRMIRWVLTGSDD
ncbi:MAG: hypothetical protein J5629_00620 [Muribaculaceae bacterium]|nr:hypothetical protein [Muribaculaceae bacterium]